jgi:hypothetical protein
MAGPNDELLLADLHRFGPPLFVPGGPWWVAAIENTGGQPDAALVFGGDGEVEVRTKSLARGITPISIRVRNVQGASVDLGRTPLPSPEEFRSRWDKVIVEEVERDIAIDGEQFRVRALQSHNTFNIEVVLDERIISAAGERQVLKRLRIERQEQLSLTGHA